MQTHLVNKEQQKTEKYLAPDLSRLLGELVASTQLVMTSEPRQVQPSAGGLGLALGLSPRHIHMRDMLGLLFLSKERQTLRT